jgi:L-asparaginase
VTKLMFLQSHYDDPDMVRHMMNRSIRGEITV